jgi:hypothetical protein
MFSAKANDDYFDAAWVLECQDCLVEQMNALPTEIMLSATRTDSPPASQKPPGLKLNLAILGISAGRASETTESAVLELKRYLAAPVANDGVDPLVWWHVNLSLYPHCAFMARKILAIPGKLCLS